MGGGGWGENTDNKLLCADNGFCKMMHNRKVIVGLSFEVIGQTRLDMRNT